MMRIFKYIVTVMLMALVVANTSAQVGNDLIQNIRTELERTDGVIERAREMVRASSAPPAALALEHAIALQRQAWENFYKGTINGYTLAAKLTNEAREQARRALTAARFSEQGEDAVERKLERAEELLHRAHETMPRGVDESLQTIFESARRNLKQAWEFYRARKYRPAVKLSNQVEKTATRLLQIANRQQNFLTNFQRRAEAVKELLERVRAQLANCQSESAQRLFHQAQESYQKAQELADKRQFEHALKQLQQARRLALQAAESCGQSGNIRTRLERLAAEADRLRELISQNDETAKRLLEQVYSQLQNARGFIERQDNEAAAAALRAAQLTLKQLKEYLNDGEI